MEHNSSRSNPFLKTVLEEVPTEPFGVTIRQLTSGEPKLLSRKENHI